MKYSVKVVDVRGNWHPFENLDQVEIEQANFQFNTDVHLDADGKSILFVNFNNALAVSIKGQE